jgi:hypothetical protein
MNDEHYVDLETLGDGAAIALVNREFQKVWDNIADANTVAKAKRSVTLTISFTPDLDRKKAEVDIEVKSSLAPNRGSDATIWFGKKDGKIVAAEANPNQQMLFGDKEKKLSMVPIKREEGESK